MKKILVTGGSGFIGSHTCYSLLENNYDLFVIDSLTNSYIKSIERIKKMFINKKINISEKLKFFKGDLRNKKFLDSVFKKANEEGKAIEGVVHFAGLKDVSESIANPFLYWENNVLGSFNLLKSMDENNCKNIVFSSSASIYKNNSLQPIMENSEIKPCTPYGQTKAAIENILEGIFKTSRESWRIAKCLTDPEYHGKKKIIVDFRPPNIIRIALTPLYISFNDIYTICFRLIDIIESKEYERKDKSKNIVT